MATVPVAVNRLDALDVSLRYDMPFSRGSAWIGGDRYAQRECTRILPILSGRLSLD